MVRPNDREVAMIKGRNRVGVEPLRQCDDRCVDDPERKVPVLRHQFQNAFPIRCQNWRYQKLTVGDRFGEGHLSP